MDDEHNYDSLQLTQPLKLNQTGILKPKVFSLTQSMNQHENLVIKPTGNRDRMPFAENPKTFKTGRLLGGGQSVKRSPIFPALQRLQRPLNQQKPQSEMPFFTLLNSSTPASTSTTTANVLHSQPLPAHPGLSRVDSSPYHDHEPSCTFTL
jgi:hypothetical protein